MINYYCREPGIRSLERFTKKILEKVYFFFIKGCLLNCYQKYTII